MIVETLQCGTVTTLADSPVIAGTTPYSDDSDGTYTILTTDNAVPYDSTYQRQDKVQADLDLLTMDPALVTEITAHMRASATTNAPDCRALIEVYDSAGAFVVDVEDGGVLYSGMSGWGVVADNTISDYAQPLSTYSLAPSAHLPNGTDLETVATALAAGAQVNVRLAASGTQATGRYEGVLTVYELWFEVTGASGLPPCRIFPRRELGAAGGRVHFPGERSQQAHRWGGAYY